MRKVLFVVRDLPRKTVSVDALIRGDEALSGTHTSGVLVAEGLARRGYSVAFWVVQGQSLADTQCLGIPTLEEAARWIGDGPVVWLSYGDASIFEQLSAHGLKPIVWTHLPVSKVERAWLEQGLISGIVVVSDTCRVPLLRSVRRDSVGRIYNPLAPAFGSDVKAGAERFQKQAVVYAGAAGPTKGLHRLLGMWRFVHRENPKATLLLAGTGRLYGAGRELGPFGIASPEFEDLYVGPLVKEFGSLAEAGIEPLGLMPPGDLRQLYLRASLGVVNPNWDEFTETFCCAAVEMMATGLPVFSVARGALPETIGRSGGAVLTQHKEFERAALELSKLLRDAHRLAELGGRGSRFVKAEYSWESITTFWERMLDTEGSLGALSGRWRGPRSARYYLECVAGRLRLHWLLDGAAAALRTVRAG